MRELAIWWSTLSALGWLAWPLVAALFPRLPGRGYAYARALGLLLLSYLYWLLGVAGVIPNATWAAWGVVALLALAGVILGLRQRAELGEFLRREWRHILTVELLLIAVLVLYTAHKSYDPAIDHTEEPMDFAFLNGILRSPRMPPNDPWLSGHTISYYYLGYLTVAMLTRLTALPAGVGYNLGLAHTLALFVVGAYGVLYDLTHAGADRPRSDALAVIGALVIALASNLEGFIELLRARGLGGEVFYTWLAVPGLAEAAPGGSWLPEGGWWWWRASRVISDVNFLGRLPTVITEFPAFSLILGDLHPHVMALPYTLLALALAVELYHDGQAGIEDWRRSPRYWLAPWMFGALGFLNSWDLPTIGLIGALALIAGRRNRVLQRVHREKLGFGDEPPDPNRQPVTSGRQPFLTIAFVALLAWLGVGSLLPYIPFYLRLNSQAQGIGLVYYAKTPLKHYVLCLGLWLAPIAVDTVARFAGWRQRGDSGIRRRTPWLILAAILLLPWLITLLLGGWGRFLIGLGVAALVGPWLLLIQSALLTIIVLNLWQSLRDRDAGSEAVFAQGLALIGIGLTYTTEFVYLRDLFDTRMNTMFKFYYQAWVLLGLAAALAVRHLWMGRGWRRVAVVLSGLLLLSGLYYPIAAAYTKAGGYRGAATLDGTAYLADESPDEDGAYRWLNEHAQPGEIMVEAPGEEYDASTNRLSAWTGVPTILGWPGHEAQWRGSEKETMRRLPDLETIYTSTDMGVVLETLRRYGANYLYVGDYERDKYGLSEARLAWYESFLQAIYVEGGVRLYRIPAE